MLDIKNELRIAQVRIEAQIDLLAYKDKEISRLFYSITRSLDNPNGTVVLSQSINNTSSSNGMVLMRDKHDAGQVGAQGPNAHVHDISFYQIWNQNKEQFDLPKLNSELKLLRECLIKEAKNPEQYSEIGIISEAKIDAANGNGSKILNSLSKVRKWSLETAEKIGVGLATAAIRISMGI